MRDWDPAGVGENDVTPEKLYLSRREFLAALGMGALSGPAAALGAFDTDEETTKEEFATGFNNFLEFAGDKRSPARLAARMKLRPWTVAVEGLCRKPRRWDADELLKRFPQEDRIYRFRCVEAWSMVVPWRGFPLAALLKEADPAPEARFVEFTSLLDEKIMPGTAWAPKSVKWPYREGLRLDEAMHPLTLMVTGMYGKSLPAQNGAPLRLMVPWKYGFKSAKSIVRVRFAAERPSTIWSEAFPEQYGFYANVNPERNHPHWSQARERRLGETFKRPTLLFNGYGPQVASLYAGMDLMKWH